MTPLDDAHTPNAATTPKERLMVYASFANQYSKYHRISHNVAMVEARGAYSKYKSDFVERNRPQPPQPIVVPKKKRIVHKKNVSKKEEKKEDVSMSVGVDEASSQQETTSDKGKEKESPTVPPPKNKRKRTAPKKNTEHNVLMEEPDSPPKKQKTAHTPCAEQASVDPGLKTFFDKCPPSQPSQ